MDYTLDGVVTKACYDAYLSDFPGIQKLPGHGKFFSYLMATGLIDRGSKLDEHRGVGIFTPFQIIQLCYQDYRTSTQSLLDRFLDEVAPFPVSQHNRHLGVARRVYIPATSKYRELNKVGTRCVNLSTGGSASDQMLRIAAREARKEAEATITKTSPLFQAQQMLHDVDPRNFQVRTSDYQATLHHIEHTYPEEEAERWRTAVDRVYDQAPRKPIYFQPDNSPRIYARHQLLYLPGPIRRRLLPGHNEMDLKAAHLAITARVLELDELHRFLVEGGDIWQELQTHSNLARQQVKDVVNPFLNGAGVAAMAEEAEVSVEAVKHLLSHRFLKAVSKARNARAVDIAERGGVELPFSGRWVGVTDKVTPLSLIAQVNQDYEAQIISRVFAYAAKVPDLLRIVYFQHDGFTFHVKTRVAEDVVMRGFRTYVDMECERLGIPTRLVDVVD